MDSEQQDKKRTNAEFDRLSTLPDDLIHKILTFIGLKRAIETSVLSSRWRFIWTSLPCLDFSIQDFPTPPKFIQFVTNVLSRRNYLAQVYSIKLCFCGDFGQDFAKQLLNYAFSRNIQKLNAVCLLGKNIELPLSLFSSQTLKHFSLTAVGLDFRYSVAVTSTLDLPALKTLRFNRITLRYDNDQNTDKFVGFFSKCVNLKNLSLESCKMKGLNGLSICYPLLSNLSLDSIEGSVKDFDVDAPKLKNLKIRNSSWQEPRYIISAPELASLCYIGDLPLNMSTDGFHCLEKADLCMYTCEYVNCLEFIHLFEQLKSVKFLTINLEIVELLSSFVEQISNLPSPFANLKSLKIYPRVEISEYYIPKNVEISVDVIKYFLDSSSNAIYSMITREEIRDMKNTKLAQKDMANFQVWLEREKSDIETSTAFMEEEKKKASEDSHTTKRHEQEKTRFENLSEFDKKLLQDDERITEINACWKDLNRQIEKGNRKTRDIISKLHDIKEILIKLPTSTRAEMQECFSSLCAEANVIVNKILDHMKIQCDMKRSDFSVHFNDIASTSQPPS